MIQLINLLSVALSSLGVVSYMVLMLRHKRHMDYILFSIMMILFLISLLEVQGIIDRNLGYMAFMRVLYACFLFRIVVKALWTDSKTTRDLLKNLGIIKKSLTWDRLLALPMNYRIYVKEAGTHAIKTYQDDNQIMFTASMGNNRSENFISEFDKVFFLKTGQCTIVVRQESHVLKEGEGLVVPRQEKHTITSSSSCSLTIIIRNN